MKFLNLGILAHVDAGKTTLTERLLFHTGVIAEMGSVDHGDTQTDSTPLERQRGITIRSAVASFVIDDVTINLIDTPGHPDFIAEVERVLRVLDGVILVISAVEGVQAQTRVLVRVLRRLRIPTLIFVNKIDRPGAQFGELLAQIRTKLDQAVIPMGSTAGLGTAPAQFLSYPDDDSAFGEPLLEILLDHDDTLLAEFVTQPQAVSPSRMRKELARQTKSALVLPVFFGSAMTGAGIGALIEGVTTLLPTARQAVDEPACGTVFKIERGPTGGKAAYVRMSTGILRTRDRVQYFRTPESTQARPQKVTAITVFHGGSTTPTPFITAGQIGRVMGLADSRVGDTVRVIEAFSPARKNRTPPAPVAPAFAPPSLETVVVPTTSRDSTALHSALVQLAEQDPLINLREDADRQEISVSLYGEVQKEVIAATLVNDFGLQVTFRETTTICIERPAARGAAVEFIGIEPNPFLATVGLRIEPAPPDTGQRFRLGVELGSMPIAFFRAVEETVTDTLRQGLFGWQVIDCSITMTHCGYWARQSHAGAGFDKSMSSTAGDFRNLTPLVLMAALRECGTTVCEPLHRFRLELPTDSSSVALQALAEHRAVPRSSSTDRSVTTVEGDIPAGMVHGLEQRLPGLTRGEAVLQTEFDHYQPVHGQPQIRARQGGADPLRRRDYLLRVLRRI